MNKLLVLLVVLVGCNGVPSVEGINAKLVRGVEDDYPVLKCIASSTPGAVLCKDLSGDSYICFTTAGYPRNTACLYGHKPSIPYKYIGGNLTVGGGSNETFQIGTYYNLNP